MAIISKSSSNILPVVAWPLPLGHYQRARFYMLDVFYIFMYS
jgi:hypothetical protein